MELEDSLVSNCSLIEVALARMNHARTCVLRFSKTQEGNRIMVPTPEKGLGTTHASSHRPSGRGMFGTESVERCLSESTTDCIPEHLKPVWKDASSVTRTAAFRVGFGPKALSTLRAHLVSASQVDFRQKGVKEKASAAE